MIKQKTPGIVYIISALYSIAILFSIYYLVFGFFPLFWLLGMLILKPLYKGGSYWTDATLLLFLWLIVRGEAGQNDSFLYLSLMSIVLFYAAYPLKAKSVLFITVSIIGSAALVVLYNDSANMNSYKYFLIIATLIGLCVHIINSYQSRYKIEGPIDFILCSYSGNTGHYSDLFIQSAKKTGVQITAHRFHYYNDFNPKLKGNSLIISFPVLGWKPPWHLMEYIIKQLPRGNGKPAFILYSSYGGPENAGFIAWLLLTIKGYRVIGRNWAMYPMNVATFRIGTASLWRRIDKTTPSVRDIDEIEECGKKIALQQNAGLPIIFWPFLLFIAGLIFENKWINIVLYRNYAWRRRCNKCGKCVNSCPSERLFFDKNKYPAAKGTCALCLICVNICPTNAMQLRFWTEYGQPYRPRWPEFVVKNKKTRQRSFY